MVTKHIAVTQLYGSPVLHFRTPKNKGLVTIITTPQYARIAKRMQQLVDEGRATLRINTMFMGWSVTIYPKEE